jgi:hypothetical protein
MDDGELTISEPVHFVDERRARRKLCSEHPVEQIFEFKSPHCTAIPLRDLDRDTGEWPICERVVIPRAQARVSEFSA